MGRMVRKQLYLDAEIDARLARAADERGVSQAEVVREALDEYLARLESGRGDTEWLHEMWRDADRYGIGSGGRKWTRDELYDDRIR
ncbi:MAG: type II toxin-antitoxin system VapB family antitoxin [Coriobacteriales bacterium]|nr:type II toxin-antitoxin system VapB family antitoxin [Coriobacteriales bacterium]